MKTNRKVYLHWSDQPHEVVAEFKAGEQTYLVLHRDDNYYDEFFVTSEKNCHELEDTLLYKRNKELKELDDNIAVKVKDIQDKALETLETRIKLNTLFNTTSNSWLALEIAKQLRNIIEKKETI